MTGIWESRDVGYIEEVCRALVRIPVIKQTQIAHLLGTRRQQAIRLVNHSYDTLLRFSYNPMKHGSERYNGGQGMRCFIRLSSDATREWSEREGIIPRMALRGNQIIRYLVSMDVLIALRRANLIYNDWDVSLPQEQNSPFHVVLRHLESGYKLGIYLLPQKYTEEKARKKLSVIHGTLRQVDQRATVDDALYLIPREFYADALKMILKLNLATPTTYLLPIESFIERPRYYLWAIRLGEKWYLEQLLKVLQPMQVLTCPVPYGYALLVKLDDRIYRFIDSYVAGDIGRLRSWLNSTNSIGYHVPNTSSIAVASVFVLDDAMQAALSKLSQGSRNAGITQFIRWPED
jgi:hypothetical protein